MTGDKRIWEAYWRGDEDREWWKRPAPGVVEFIASQSPGERPEVLDLGCGLGRHAIACNVVYHGPLHYLAAAIRLVRQLLKPDGLFYFTCPSRQDGKYGFGREIAPHTFLCEKSATPGGIHYFADREDLDRLLTGFTGIERQKREGHWDNRGERQFYSNWRVLARRA
jgi:SAM-dependent methyltransferase